MPKVITFDLDNTLIDFLGRKKKLVMLLLVQ